MNLPKSTSGAAFVPVLPLRSGVVPPGRPAAIPVGRPRSIELIDSLPEGGLLCLAVQRDREVEEPTREGLHEVAVLARVLGRERRPRGVLLRVEALSRVRLGEVDVDAAQLSVALEEVVETRADDPEALALRESVSGLLEEILPKELGVGPALAAAPDAGRVADLIVSFIDPDDARKEAALLELDVVLRLRDA